MISVKSKIRLAAALSFVLLLTCGKIYAAFLVESFGSRAAGKAGAVIATIDDASAAGWNPAGLANIKEPSALFEYYSPFSGLPGVSLDYMLASLVYPYPEIGHFGISYSVFRGDGIYCEHALSLSAARELNDWIPDFGKVRVAAGVNLKYLYHGYDWEPMDSGDPILNDPITKKDGAGAFTADLGFIVEPVEQLPLGLSFRNIIPADIGLKEKDSVPFSASLGAGYRIYDAGYFKSITPELSFIYRDQVWGDPSDKIKLSAGVEAWLKHPSIGIRTGLSSDEVAFGASYGMKAMENISMQLDYAAVLPFTPLSDHWGHHRVSLSANFFR